MDLNQEIEDCDDFDIYADLDDHDIDFGADIVFSGSATADSDWTQNLTKNVESSEETFGSNDDMIGSNDDITQSVTQNSDKTKSFDPKCDNSFSNDMILSELTILEKNLHKTEDINKTLESKNEELRKQLDLKDKQLLVLKRNISSLFKTAKQEIARHRREIDGLRQELDSIIFRRIARKETKVEASVESSNGSIDEKNFSDNCSQTKPNVETVDTNHKKSPDSSVRSPKKQPNSSRRRSRSKSCQRLRRSRSRDRRYRDRDRNTKTDRSSKRSDGIHDNKGSTLHREEDRKRRSDANDSKSRNDSKKTKNDKK